MCEAHLVRRCVKLQSGVMRQRGTEEWTKWRGLVSEQIASGQSVAAFCRDRGLRDGQFYDWKKRVSEAEAVKFVSVKVAPGEGPAAVAAVKSIEIRLRRGRSLVVEPGFDAQHLRALLSVLEPEA